MCTEIIFRYLTRHSTMASRKPVSGIAYDDGWSIGAYVDLIKTKVIDNSV